MDADMMTFERDLSATNGQRILLADFTGPCRVPALKTINS